MSTHNICFRGEIRKIFTGYPPLSRPMTDQMNAASDQSLYCLALLQELLENTSSCGKISALPTRLHVPPTKIQISLHIHAV